MRDEPLPSLFAQSYGHAYCGIYPSCVEQRSVGACARVSSTSRARPRYTGSGRCRPVACMVGQSTNRHSEITADLKRPLFCGVTRAVRLPWRT
jgi:hypothetical protein